MNAESIGGGLVIVAYGFSPLHCDRAEIVAKSGHHLKSFPIGLGDGWILMARCHQGACLNPPSQEMSQGGGKLGWDTVIDL
jgi:hypothetical protein